MASPYRICILGGGIIGLTTCCYFLKTYTPSSVTITLISDEFSPNITSTVAAGYWHPSDDEHLTRLALHSYDIFLAESLSIKAQNAGVMSMLSYVLHGSGEKYPSPNYIPNNLPLFSSSVKHFHQLSSEELQMFDILKPVSGYMFTTVVVETRKYLHCLMRYIKQQANVEIIQRHVSSFDELSSIQNFDLVVNCTGLGARELVNEDAPNLCSGRGQVVRVQAPYIKSVYLFDSGLGYIIPQTDHVVLGGTIEKNNENKEIDADQTKEILRKTAKVFPSLLDGEIKEVCVGLRPFRTIHGVTAVRVEFDREERKVIHNYGHGGNGVSLSWGCARQVVELAQTLIPSNRSDQRNRASTVVHEQLWQLIE